MTRVELAEASRVSADTIRRWEEGRRNPTLPRLMRVLDALGCPEAEANAILQGLGFPRLPLRFTAATHPNYYFKVDELQAVVEQASWPEFVVNDNMEIVAANSTVQALWGADFDVEKERRRPYQMNLVGLASSPEFIAHILNWDEVVATIASALKWGAALAVEHPHPYMSQVLAEFASGDPAYLKRLMDIFAETPAREPRCRWTYSVHWRDDEAGDMRFVALVNTASEIDGLAFNDWIPADAETWSNVESIRARGAQV